VCHRAWPEARDLEVLAAHLGDLKQRLGRVTLAFVPQLPRLFRDEPEFGSKKPLEFCDEPEFGPENAR
jgi:hypothetical protein